MKQFVISKDGTKIAYEKVGRGPVVIFVLGALNSRTSGATLAKLLSSRFTVVNYDRRGRGDSSDTKPYSPVREIEDVEAVVGAVGGTVCLYGHSSGGALALETAIKLGRQVRKLAVYEVPYSVDPETRRAGEEYYAELRRLLAAGRKGDAVALFMRLVGVSDKQVQAIRRMPMWRGLEKLAPTLAYDSELLGEGYSLPAARLSRITTATLVMHGGAGSPSMRDAAQAISKAIAKARLLTLVGQTQGVRPKALAPILEEFFS